MCSIVPLQINEMTKGKGGSGGKVLVSESVLNVMYCYGYGTVVNIVNTVMPYVTG